MTAYNTAQAGYVVRETRTVGKSHSAPGSLSAAIAAYYTDNSFTGELGTETQKARRTAHYRQDAADPGSSSVGRNPSADPNPASDISDHGGWRTIPPAGLKQQISRLV